MDDVKNGNIIPIDKDKPKQYDIDELVEHLQQVARDKKVERMLVIYHEQEDGLCFACGSESRDYSLADVNWDLDQYKLTHLTGGYELIDD